MRPILSTIISTQPAPTGWVACYLSESGSLVTMPVILWALVEYLDDDLGTQELRHFVASPDGAIVDYEEIDDHFVCVVEPGRDARSIALARIRGERDLVGFQVN